jgi:hypothetical protein
MSLASRRALRLPSGVLVLAICCASLLTAGGAASAARRIRRSAEGIAAQRPRVSLTAINSPITAYDGVPATFTFIVAETTGDADAAVRLRVKDRGRVLAQIDLAVPAGGQITAPVTATLSSIRLHKLSARAVVVEADNGDDGDDDDEDAAAAKLTLTIDLQPRPQAVATISEAGGSVRLPNGASLEIPAGALDRETQISMRIVADTPPPGFGGLFPVYRFQPEGLVFARPVKITLPLPAGVTSASIYWSRLVGSGFDPIGGVAATGVIEGQSVHFSAAFIGAASAVRTVTGVGMRTWISASSRISQPIDFGAQVIDALVPDGTGGFTRLPAVAGTGAALGTFAIENVPSGEYMLHAGGQFIATSASTLDLGFLTGGRPDAARLTAPAFLDLSLSALEPWQTGDVLEFFSTEVNDWDFGTDRFAALSTGETSASLAFDVSLSNGGDPPSAIQGSRGDTAYVAQLSSRISSAGVPFLAMSRVAKLPPFDLAPGDTVSVATTMLDVSQTNTVGFDFRGSQFHAAVRRGNPAQTTLNGVLAVLAQPGRADDGFYSANADLLQVDTSSGSDLLSGSMEYGSPTDAGLGGNWGIIFFARVASRVRMQPLPGTTGLRPRRAFSDFIAWTTSTAAAQAAPIVPPVALPAAITVNSSVFYAGGSGIRTTPTLSWSRGAVGGDPAFYRLTIVEKFADPQNLTDVRTVADLLTTNTTLTLPPGILGPSAHYIFQLSAYASTSGTAAALLASAPFKNGLDIAQASTVSGDFVP